MENPAAMVTVYVYLAYRSFWRASDSGEARDGSGIVSLLEAA